MINKNILLQKKKQYNSNTFNFLSCNPALRANFLPDRNIDDRIKLVFNCSFIIGTITIEKNWTFFSKSDTEIMDFSDFLFVVGSRCNNLFLQNSVAQPLQFP